VIRNTLRDLGLEQGAEIFLGVGPPRELARKSAGGPLESKVIGQFDRVIVVGAIVELHRPKGRRLSLRAERILWRWDEMKA
jgi:hypothetical protein